MCHKRLKHNTHGGNRGHRGGRNVCGGELSFLLVMVALPRAVSNAGATMTKTKDLTDSSSERGLIGAILLDPAVLIFRKSSASAGVHSTTNSISSPSIALAITTWLVASLTWCCSRPIWKLAARRMRSGSWHI